MLKVEEVKVQPVKQKPGKYSVKEARSRIYIWPKGETILQNLENRRSRPINQWRKEVIPEILKQAGFPADMRVKFSQKCGCQCGCSPGWFITGHHGVKVHATIVEEN